MMDNIIWIKCPMCEGEGYEFDYLTDKIVGTCEECGGAGGWERDYEEDY